MCAALGMDLSLSSAPTSGSIQLPETPVPGGFDASGLLAKYLHSYLHTFPAHTQRDTHRVRNKFKKKNPKHKIVKQVIETFCHQMTNYIYNFRSFDYYEENF